MMGGKVNINGLSDTNDLCAGISFTCLQVHCSVLWTGYYSCFPYMLMSIKIIGNTQNLYYFTLLEKKGRSERNDLHVGLYFFILDIHDEYALSCHLTWTFTVTIL